MFGIFNLIGMFIALIGGIIAFAGFKDTKWIKNSILGKDNVKSWGETMSQAVIILIGILLLFLAGFILFWW